MKIEIKSKYLVFPVNKRLPEKRLVLRCGEKCVFDSHLRLDGKSPDGYAYVDVSDFSGKTLDVFSGPDMLIKYNTSDQPEKAYDFMRPKIHYSPKFGKLAQPLSLFRKEGVYSLSYNSDEYRAPDNNAVSTVQSRDLLSWNEAKPKINFSADEIRGTLCTSLKEYVYAEHTEGCTYAVMKHNGYSEPETVCKVRLPGENGDAQLLCMNVDGEENKSVWILYGAHGNYAVGNFCGGTFHTLGDAERLDYGTSCLGAAVIYDKEKNRYIRVACDDSASRFNGFCGQLLIPNELSVVKNGAEYFLCAKPIAELDKLCGEKNVYENVNVADGQTVCFKLCESAYKIVICGKKGVGKIDFKLFGIDFSINSESGFFEKGLKYAPLSSETDTFEVTVICDSSSLEVFLDGGKRCMAFCEDFCDYNTPSLCISADGDNIVISRLEIKKLSAVYR